MMVFFVILQYKQFVQSSVYTKSSDWAHRSFCWFCYAPAHLQTKTVLQDNPGHDNLSEKVCNEILSNPDSSTTKLWVKILNQMEISPDNEVVLKDLRILCYKMVKVGTKFIKENNTENTSDLFKVWLHQYFLHPSMCVLMADN